MKIYFSKAYELFKYGYTTKIFKGYIRRKQLKELSTRFSFDPWHISPIEFRPYALDIVKYINSDISQKSVVVEIGCGLGEIVRNIKSDCLFGLDVDTNVIRAAKALDTMHRVQYQVGSFQDVKGMNIEYLVTVNFIHDIEPIILKGFYKDLCTENRINKILLDSVTGQGYKYKHNAEEVIPSGFKLVHTSRKYNSDRRILIYQRVQ